MDKISFFEIFCVMFQILGQNYEILLRIRGPRNTATGLSTIWK
jgi:hypothetical protein